MYFYKLHAYMNIFVSEKKIELASSKITDSYPEFQKRYQ